MGDLPSDLHQQAISAALSANWEEALKLNQLIIDEDPKNVDALNRLARAYFELGNLTLAKKSYEESLKYDPYNQIAFKFLKRIEACRKKGIKHHISNCLDAQPISVSDLFIEEPGKTKVVSLLKVAEPQKLSLLSCGKMVRMVPKNRYVSISDLSGDYLGVIPDDLSHRLIRLMHGGNKYQAFIKTIKTNGISILIHETFRSSRFKNQPSFLEGSTENMIYSSEHIILPTTTDDEPMEIEGEGEEEVV